MRTFTKDEVVDLLAKAVAKAGSQGRYALLTGIKQSVISETLNARRDPSPSIVDALGLEGVTTYRRKAKTDA